MREKQEDWRVLAIAGGTMVSLAIVVSAMLVLAIGTTVAAGGGSLEITKTVPDGATIELRVRGQLAQSAPIEAGTYHITVRRVR